MRIPIFDLKYSGIVKDIFMQSSPIQELDGLGVTNHILDSFEAFGLPLTYQHNNASGMAMDGQYTKLNVETHMRDILVKIHVRRAATEDILKFTCICVCVCIYVCICLCVSRLLATLTTIQT